MDHNAKCQLQLPIVYKGLFIFTEQDLNSTGVSNNLNCEFKSQVVLTKFGSVEEAGKVICSRRPRLF